MYLTADKINEFLIEAFGFKPVLQKDLRHFKRVYKLAHDKIDHLVIIDRSLKNHKILAIPLKYHKYQELIATIKNVDGGGISHHSGFTDFQNHLGTSTYKSTAKEAPPALHYGFKDTESLANFMNTLFKLVPSTSKNSIEGIRSEEADDSFTTPLSPTEKDALIKARIGQGTYRKALLDYWGGCAVTGCSLESLLISSHIKPWSVDKDARLDPFNGLLLSPTLDRAFDQRLISFNDDGSIILSPLLTETDMKLLHLDSTLRLRKIDPRHLPYLAWHRANLVKE